MPFPVVVPFIPDTLAALKAARRGGTLALSGTQVVAYAGGEKVGRVESEEVRDWLADGDTVGFYLERIEAKPMAVCARARL